MKKFAVIVAGGSGSRMNSAMPKQFLLLKGKPVLYYTIKAFLDAFPDCRIILVLPKEHHLHGLEIIDSYFAKNQVQVAWGGETRFHSVQNGLTLVEDNSVVFVHDAVRCMVSPKLIRNCYDAALLHGSAVPVISCKDSLRILSGNENKALPREQIKLVQTPQVFISAILLPAFRSAYHEHFTDEATVVEAAGGKIHLVDGEETNFKITLPIDMELAERLMEGI